MPRIETDSFAFELPVACTYLAEGPRLVCHGPDDEELIVSVTRATDQNCEASDDYVDAIFGNARETIRETIAEEKLVVLRDLAPL